MIQDALALAARGLAIFPCQPRGKEPATARGCRDATRDGALICAWWACNPDFNIGAATGEPSGIFVVDVDDAEAELSRLEAEHGPLPPTVKSITANGRHIFFRQPPGQEIRNSVSKVARGVDVRASGGHVLMPPSVHPTGRRYCWSVDSASTFAAAPEWLLAMVAAAPPQCLLREWRSLVKKRS